MPQRSVGLLESVDVNKYIWVNSEILGTQSSLDNFIIMEEANVKVRRSSN